MSTATLSLSFPADGAKAVPLNTVVSASFTEPMDPFAFDASTFTLHWGQASFAFVPGSVSFDPLANRATFVPSGDLLSGTLYTATLAGLVDLAGNAVSQSFAWTFTTVDVTPPTVIATVPIDGLKNFAGSGPIAVTFSEPMDAATVSPNLLVQRRPLQMQIGTGTIGAVKVAGTVAYVGDTAFFTSNIPLPLNNEYTVTITTAATDLAKNPLQANFVFSFLTLETKPPQVLSVSPADQSKTVSLNAVLTADFDESLDPSSVNPSTFLVQDAQGSPVAGAVSYAEDFASGTYRATFAPSGLLKASASYVATLTQGVKDIAQNAIGAPYVWGFATFSGWGAPQPIEGEPADASGASVDHDASTGETVVVWKQQATQAQADQNVNIYYSLYAPGSGWSAPFRVSDDQGTCKTPEVFLDTKTRNVHVLWIQKSAAAGDQNDNVYHRSGPLGGSWTSSQKRVSDDFNKSSSPRLFVDPGSGTVHATWIEKGQFAGPGVSDSQNNIYHSSLAAGAVGWAPQFRVSDDGGACTGNVLAGNRQNGNLYAGWLEKSAVYVPPDTKTNLHSSSWTGGVWAAQVRVSGDVANASSPALAVVESSDTLGAAWSESLGGNLTVFANSFTIAGGWQGSPSLVSDGSSPATGSDLRADQVKGNFHAAWIQKGPGNNNSNVYASFSSAGSGSWQTMGQVSDDLGVFAVNAPAVRLGPDPISGGLLLAWVATGPGDQVANVYASRNASGTGAWLSQARVSTDVAGTDKPLLVAFTDQSGIFNGICVFEQSIGGKASDLYAALLQQ